MIRPGHDTVLRALALTALLVLGLGLPRMLVFCTHADGIGKVEIAHASGTCCSDSGSQHHGRAGGEEHGERAALAHPDRGCQHVDFSIDLAPPPVGQDHGAEPPPAVCWLYEAATTGTGRTAVQHPPATGPPRTDQRSLLRACTLLLL